MSARGSAPIETVAFLTLLMLPVAPGILLYQQISNQLAAESIARHAIRSAMLKADLGRVADVSTEVALLARSWQKRQISHWVIQDGELISLHVQVGAAKAVATLGLEPRS